MRRGHASGAKTGDARRAGQTGAGTRTGSVRVADAAMVRRVRAISPGLSVQVGDGASAVQKLALRRACRDVALKGAVDGFLSGRTIDGLSHAELDAVFCATAELARHVANHKTADGLTRDRASRPMSARDFGAVVTPAEINALNSKYYNRKV